jgi:hypothetical protein
VIAERQPRSVRHATTDAVQGGKRCIGQIRPRPGDATEDNKAFLIGNGGYRIDHGSRGRVLQ